MSKQIEYGKIDTQFGVTVEHLSDGGVSITIPPRGFPIRSLLGRVGIHFPPRAVITLTSTELRLVDRLRQMDTGTPSEERWPRRDVVDMRPNRYGRGIYVRIRDRDNFDLLIDLDKRLVDFVGNTLNEAMTRTGSADATPPSPAV